MRKQLLGLLVPLMAFVLIADAADMTGNGLAASAALQRLEVTHSQDGLRVEFKAKGTLAPKVTTLDSPARLVVDFPNTVMATGQSHISVGSDGSANKREMTRAPKWSDIRDSFKSTIALWRFVAPQLRSGLLQPIH